jgi:hypothetical protein
MRPTAVTGSRRNTAYLSSTDKGWAELAKLFKVREKIADWTGILYVEKRGADSDWSITVALWGDCCLVVGPFVFFGDRELLARVRDVLSV